MKQTDKPDEVEYGRKLCTLMTDPEKMMRIDYEKTMTMLSTYRRCYDHGKPG